jgi:hypothetical protein
VARGSTSDGVANIGLSQRHGAVLCQLCFILLSTDRRGWSSKLEASVELGLKSVTP